MRSSIGLGSFLALVCVSTVAAQAALQSGSLLNGIISQSYSSKDAYVGQAVALQNVTSDDGSGTVTNGTLYGTVSQVQKASQGRPGKIEFQFTRLVTHSGVTYAVTTTVTKIRANTKSNAVKEAGGALAGMAVGNMLGKTLFQASGGGVVGAAGGFLLAKNNRQDISVPAGTIVQVQVNAVTRRQSH
jgi:hypothetical protein